MKKQKLDTRCCCCCCCCPCLLRALFLVAAFSPCIFPRFSITRFARLAVVIVSAFQNDDKGKVFFGFSRQTKCFRYWCCASSSLVVATPRTKQFEQREPAASTLTESTKAHNREWTNWTFKQNDSPCSFLRRK